MKTRRREDKAFVLLTMSNSTTKTPFDYIKLLL